MTTPLSIQKETAMNKENRSSSSTEHAAPDGANETQHSAGWRHIIQCDFDRFYVGDEWLLVATDEPSITIAKPFNSGVYKFWVTGTGPNLSDPRWPCEYLPFRAVAWQRLPPHPAKNSANSPSDADD